MGLRKGSSYKVDESELLLSSYQFIPCWREGEIGVANSTPLCFIKFFFLLLRPYGRKTGRQHDVLRNRT